MTTLKTQALVIGAGTGGYPCAIRLGQLGIDTILVEKAKPGGVCLNWGCIPSKALINATKLFHKAQHNSSMGISFQQPNVDMAQMQTWKEGIVNRLTKGVKGLVQGSGTQYITATAHILGPNRVRLRYPDKADDIVECEHLVIATGSLPIELPNFKVDQKYIFDSTGILELTKIPKRMVCIGGGIIGLELGQTFQRLGTELIVLEGQEQILASVDPECAAVVAKQIKKDGGQIHIRAKATGVRKKPDGVVVQAEIDGKQVDFDTDCVLVAVGRRPVSKGFGLEELGVKLDQRGFIVVDSRMQTNIPKVYAIGDVVPGPMLAHKSSHEGEVVAEVIAGKKTINDVRSIPNVVFTEPEIASAGLDPHQAEAAGYQVSIGKFPFSVSGRAMSINETNGFVKVVIDAKDSRVLGIHIVGAEASDLISEASLALEMGAFAEDIALTIHPHPTLGEAVMEAAKHALGEAIHIPNQRKQQK